MALNVEINGANKNAFTRYKKLRIQKDGAIETCRVEFLDHDLTSGAFRPVPGDELRVDRNGTALEFGGEVVRVTDQRLTGLDNPAAPSSGLKGGGTVTVVEARGWYFEASDVKIPFLTLAPQGLHVAVEHLRGTYLDAKGWQTLNPTTGGPELPMLVYIDQTVAQIFDDFTKKVGWPWRVNGDRYFAFVEPGSLLAPNVYDNTNSIVLRGAEWTKDRVRRATRLFITTGGSGQHLEFFSDHTADGTFTHFPVHVLPPEVVGAVNNVGGYTIGTTSLAIDGLPKSFTFIAGTSIRFNSHAGYLLSADTTTNADGEGTFTLGAGLSAAVVDDESVTFDSSATVRLEVDGTPTALGGDWTFDREQAQFIKTGSTPTAGTIVRYKVLLSYPARVRVWAEEAQGTFGNFNYLYVVDKDVNRPEFTDVVSAKLAGAIEVTQRVLEPKEVRLSTFTQEVYPWMLATCSFPERLVTGDYMVQTVVLTDVGKRNQDPRVELTLLEGSAIGRNWRTFWQAPSGGTEYAPTGDPVVPDFQWTTNRQFIAPAGATAISITPSGTVWANSSYIQVTASTDSAWVLTGVVCAFPGGSGLFTSGDFEIDVAVGAVSSEVVIATLKGRFRNTLYIADPVMRLPIPIDAIPSGSRVSLRLRINDTDTTAWRFAITYLKKPIVGDVQTTTKPSKVVPSSADVAGLTLSATTWANGPWNQLIASTATDIVIVALIVPADVNSNHWEIDIGVGAASSESVVMTLKGVHSSGSLGSGPDYIVLQNPLTGIASGSRVSARARCSNVASSATKSFAFVYHESPL